MILFIILINLVLYFRTLRYKFVSDDFAVFKNPPKYNNRFHKRFLQLIGAIKLQSDAYVPICEKGKFSIVKIKSEEQEHLLALIIHILICIGIYIAFGMNYISFIAAVFFSVNPVNNQATIWPGGRGYALPMLFMLGAMIFPKLSILFLIGCTWFTIGFLAPLAFIGSGYNYILLLLPLAWASNIHKFFTAVKNKSEGESFTEDAKFHWKKIILAIKTFGFYFCLCLVPFRITFYHNFLQSCAGNVIMKRRAYSLCKYFWIGVFVTLGWLYYVFTHGWNTLSWSLFAFMITIGPFCNLRRANQEIAERFTALPNLFLMFFLAQIVWQYPILVGAIAGFYIARTHSTLIMYKDEYFITELAIVEDPHAWWAWHCRAMKRWETQSYREALILWVMAKTISPKEFKVLMNIATCLRLLKNHKEADLFLDLAKQNIVPGQEKDANYFIEKHIKGDLPILL